MTTPSQLSTIQLPDLPEAQALEAMEVAMAAAQKRLEDLVDGNGLHRSKVRVSEKQLHIHPLQCELIAKFLPQPSVQRIAGKVEKGTVITGEGALNGAIDTYLENAAKDPNLQNAVITAAGEEQFALSGEKHIDLKALATDFSYAENCEVCKGQVKMTCGTCAGSGKVKCGTCDGTGRIPCFQCKGKKYLIDNDGNRIKCFECDGYGSTPCHNCGGAKMVTCSNCGGDGTIECNTCNRTGKQTVVHSVGFKTEFRGYLNSPRDEVIKTYEDFANLYSARELVEHKDIVLKPLEGSSPRFKQGALNFDLGGYVPYGQVAFSLDGKRVDASVFGHNGRMKTESTFLDDMLKPGISALSKIVKGPLATTALFDQARNYRVIKDVINMVPRASKKKILAQTLKNYPIGLSEKYAKLIVSYADKALTKVMVKPRWIGAGIGSAIALVTLFAWFHMGIRPEAISKGSLNFQVFVDGTIAGLNIILTSFVIKAITQNTLKSILGDTPKKLPKAGDQALAAAGLILIATIALGATAPIKPLWFSKFF